MKQNWRISFLITHARYASSPFTEGCDPTAQQLKHSPSFLGSAGIQTIPLPWGYVKVPPPLPKHVALLFRRSWHILLCLDYDQGVRTQVLCRIKGLLKSYLNFRPLKAREKPQSLQPSRSNMVGKPTTGKG